MKDKTTIISVTTLRDEMSMILNRVKLLGESYVITNHGRPLAILGPYKEKPKTNKSPKR